LIEKGFSGGCILVFMFTKQRKGRLYVNFQAVLFNRSTDPLRLSYRVDQSLAVGFEELLVIPIREWVPMEHPKDMMDIGMMHQT
jgi:hypothetical protein